MHLRDCRDRFVTPQPYLARLAIERLEDRFVLAGWSPGDFLVADPASGRIAIYDETFSFQDYIDPAMGSFPSVFGMDFLPNGNLVAASQGATPEVRQYDPAGNLVSSFTHAALGTPWDIKASADGLLYVGTDDVDLGVSEFDVDGNLLRNFVHPDPDVNDGYTGVAVLPSGEIWAGELDRVGFVDVYDTATGLLSDSIVLDHGQTVAETMTLGSVILVDPFARKFYRRNEDGTFVQQYEIPTTLGVSILGIATDTSFLYATAVVSSPFVAKWDLSTGVFTSTVISNEVAFPGGIAYASTVATGVEIAIEKTTTTSDVVEGGQLTYTIRVTNSGTQTAENVRVNDSLPAGVTFVSTSGCAEDPNMVSSGVVTCTLGNIPADEFREFTLAIQVDANYVDLHGGTITNTAEVLAGDGNTDFDDTTVETPVLPGADVEMTEKLLLGGPFNEVPPRPVAEGDLLTYAIDVRNNGPATAINVVVEDALPTSMTLLGAEYSFLGPSGSSEPTPCALPCTIPELASGDAVRVRIDVRVEQVGEFTNTAIVAAANDSTPDNNNQSATVTVHPAVDAGGPYQVDQGQSTTLNGTCNSCTDHSWDRNNDGTFETPGQSVTFGATDIPGEYPVGYQGCTAVPEFGDICNEDDTTVTVLPVAFGTLTIVKDAEPDGPQDFAFMGDLGQFTLDDDDDPALPASRTFVVVPGFHFIQETLPPGWAVADIECDANFADDGPNVTVQVDDGANVTCTFKNVKLGTIEIIKSASPEDPQDFDFDGELGHFSLDDDNDPTLPNSRFVENLLPGTYSITEAIAPGWDLTLIQCFDPTGDTVEDLAARTATINLAPGEDVTCIFTNEKQLGSITIIKDALPDGPQDFEFTGDLEPFSLDDDSDPTLPDSRVFPNLPPGSYTVLESVPAGWDLTSVVCFDPDGGTTTGTAGANIDLDNGEEITCTFTNTQRATITIIKDAEPDDPQDFDFDGSLGHFSLDDDSDPTLANLRTFTDVEPGTYEVSEIVPQHWVLSVITCDDDNSAGSLATNTATIRAEPGEHVRCTFFNQKQLGTITIIKDALPDGPQDFDFDGDLGHFSLDDDADPSLPNSRTFSVEPGSYTVTESIPPGWRLDGIICDGAFSPGPSVTIDVEADEEINCRFFNIQLGAITVVKDFIGDGEEGANFEVFTSDGLVDVITLDENPATEPLNSKTLEGLLPGEYFIGEQVFPSRDLFELQEAECIDATGNSTVEGTLATVALEPGEHVTCVFTNRHLGKIVVEKQATPATPDEFTFLSTAHFPGTPGSQFSLFGSNATGPTRREHVFLPGAYTVQELVPDGWFLNGLVCFEEPGSFGNQTPSTVEAGTATATIGLDPRETVTCTFFNEQIDADADGLSDLFEGGFGGAGVTVGGAGSVSATGDAESGSTITADDVTVMLPPGTTAATPDTEVQFTISPDPPAAAISGVVLPAGATKSIELPIGGQNAVCIDDSPAATIESVATGNCASPQVEVGVPSTVGESLASGQYTVTRTSDTHVRVDGLTHSAVAMITSSIDDGDGNVTARVRLGFALIEGDGGDNAIRITRGSTSQSVVVTGIGTTVNGQSGPVEIGGILFGFSMDLKAGDDRVFFEGAGFPLVGGIVRTGSGNDLVRFDSFSAAGNPGLLFVDTGDDEDEIIVQNSLLPAVWFELGRGNDRVTALDSVFGGPAALLTQAGDDAVVLEATHFHEAALVALGSGNDSLRIGAPDDPTRAARFDKALALVGDAGFDALDAGLLSNPNAYGNDLGSPLVLGFEQIDS